jgi:hypothetical protein
MVSAQLVPLEGGPLGGCTVRVYGRVGDQLLFAGGRYVRIGFGEWCWEADLNPRRPPDVRRCGS